MQRALRSLDSRSSLRVWRVLALGSSLLAIATALVSRSSREPCAVHASAAVRLSAPEVPAAMLEPTRAFSALRMLTEAGDDGALDSLVAISEQATPRVASAALKGIVQIGGKRARDNLAQRFADGRDSELAQLADALAQLGGPEAHAILVQAARSTRMAARGAARAALASLDTPDARSFMLEELSGPDATQAVQYFADCQDVRALPTLERLARDSVAELRQSAISALFAQGDSARPAIERLLLDDDVSNDVLGIPAPTAGLRRTQRAASILRLRAGAITSGPVFDFLARDLSADARRALLQAARDPGSADSALNALAARGDSASLAALSQLSDDSDAALASRAACALLTTPDSRSRPFLLRASSKLPREAAEALLRIGALDARDALDAPEAPMALARMAASARASDRHDAERLEAQYDLGL